MVQIDIPFAFASGAAFAGAVEQGLRSERAEYFRSKALVRNLQFQTFGIIWCPMYLLVYQFGLETSHMWWQGDSLTDYPGLLPAFFLLYMATNMSGFLVGAYLAARGRIAALWTMVLVCLVFMIGWVALQPYRTLSLGTYEEWRAGTARWFWTEPVLFWFLMIYTAAFNVVLVRLYTSLKREASTVVAAHPH